MTVAQRRVSVARIPGFPLLMLAAVSLTITHARAGQSIPTGPGLHDLSIEARVQTQFNTTSVEEEAGSEFLLRRARLGLAVDITPRVGGKIQVEVGGDAHIEDAWMHFRFDRGLSFKTGRFKRPFDPFYLESSKRILVIERSGEVRGVDDSRTTYGGVLDEHELAGRDIGAHVGLEADRFSAAVVVMNGLTGNPVEFGEAEVTGRHQFVGEVRARPFANRSAILIVTGSALAVHREPGNQDAGTRQATAFLFGLELGEFGAGPRLRAAVARGDAWSVDPTSPPDFLAGQVIVTYKKPLTGDWLTAIEPLFRFSYANADLEDALDAAFAFTPGVQLFFTETSKIAFNWDFIDPRNGLPSEHSFKVQTTLAH